MRPLGFLILAAAVIPVAPGLAQTPKLVNPATVAPEYREAAELRRAQQMRIAQCQREADEAKILVRDRAAHINHCLDAAAGK